MTPMRHLSGKATISPGLSPARLSSYARRMDAPLEKPPFAWQPITPRGVAAFARASWGRVLLVQFLCALAAATAVVWFLETAWFPAVTEAIRQLPPPGCPRKSSHAPGRIGACLGGLEAAGSCACRNPRDCRVDVELDSFGSALLRDRMVVWIFLEPRLEFGPKLASGRGRPHAGRAFSHGCHCFVRFGRARPGSFVGGRGIASGHRMVLLICRRLLPAQASRGAGDKGQSVH